MTHRRKFLQQTTAAGIGSLLLPTAIHAMNFLAASIPPAGLQLFTLFGVIDEDVPGSLDKIAAIGYKNLESAFSRKGGFYGMKPTEFASMVKDKGLAWKSHHVMGAPFKLPPGAKIPTGADGKPIRIPPMKTLKENASELVDQAAAGGVEYLVCANIPLNNGDEISQAIEILGKAGESCKKAGLKFAYHNHESEFKKVDGKVPYHELITQLNADLLLMELDLAWATHAGMDPVEMFKHHPGRFPLWHVKDLDKASGQPVEIGAGYIQFKPFFDNAEAAGMQYYFVEQDGAPKPFENIAHSYQNLEKMLS